MTPATRKQLVDQGAHIAAAIVTLTPLALWPSPWTGAIAGFGMGLIRELTEEGTINLAALRHCFTGPHSRLDLIFWTIGGVAAGLAAAVT